MFDLLNFLPIGQKACTPKQEPAQNQMGPPAPLPNHNGWPGALAPSSGGNPALNFWADLVSVAPLLQVATAVADPNKTGLDIKLNDGGVAVDTSATNTRPPDAAGESDKDKVTVGAEIDSEGLKKVSGGYDFEGKDGSKYGFNGNIHRNGFGAGGSVGGEGWGIGGNFDITLGAIEQDRITHSGDTTADMLGKDYVSTTRSDELSIGANGTLGAFSVNAGVTSSSSIEIIQAMDPAVWREMKKEDKDKLLLDQKNQLDNYKDGLSGLDLLGMTAGTGVHVSSSNGWNAGGGISLGAVGVNGGVGQTTATDVTIVRGATPEAPIMVNYGRQEGVSVNAGMDVFGVGGGFKNDTNTTKQTQFSIEPKYLQVDPITKLPLYPDTYNQVQNFLKTGLLPGANKLSDPGAKKAYEQFGNAQADLADLNAKIAKAQNNPVNDGTSAELTALLVQRDNAQAKIDLNRNFLNDEWQKESGAGKTLVDGVQIQGKDETKTTETSANLAGMEIGKITESWLSREYWTTKNQVEHQYGYDYKNEFFGSTLGDFSTRSDTNTDNVMLGMRSGKRLDDEPHLLALATGIDRGTASSDLMVNDKYFRDHNQFSLTIEMNEAQLMGMSNSLNDMSNPESKTMWADFGARTSGFLSGNKYWENSGQDMLTLLQANQEQVDRAQAFEQKNWLEKTYLNGAGTPAGDALRSFGKTQEEAMQKASTFFSTVKSPEQFKLLSPQNQQLFIAILDQTSGGEDRTGKHSGYEAMAAVALIDNPASRADTMNKLVADCNDAEEAGFQDAGWDFVNFTERFKDSDPATYSMLKQTMRLDFTNDELKNFENKPKADVMNDIKNAYNFQYFGATRTDPQEDTVVNGMLALMGTQDPKAKPGTAITDMVKQTGMDPVQMLKAIPADKPALRQMYIDMMLQTPYGAAVQKELDAENTCPVSA